MVRISRFGTVGFGGVVHGLVWSGEDFVAWSGKVWFGSVRYGKVMISRRCHVWLCSVGLGKVK